MVHALRQRQGFTLIELMIVVAIVGTLAAIAIPNFMRFQLRARAGEGKLNLEAIRTAQESYFAEIGTFQTWALTPAAAPNSQKTPWTTCPNLPAQPGDPGYCFLGWEPEGDVYFNYVVATNSAPPSNQFFAVAESDIDGDGLRNIWGIQKPDAKNSFTIGATQGCGQVLNAQTSLLSGAITPMLRQVGPCDNPSFGLVVF